MKLIHLSDLHIGKRLNEYSLLEDQRYILNQILGIIDEEKPDTVAIAGDVYDKTVPSAEAVELFDDFLYRISQKDTKVFVVSGNHDSPERIAFASRLIDKSGIYLSPVYDGKILPVSVKDAYGEVNVYMLPFVKPSNVRRFFPNEDINSYTDAIKVAIREMNIDPDKRNLLIAHQFVTGASRTESEDISVGGTDNVDASIFSDFDYIALGHIHRPQNIGSERIRYCGTPIKYSFSELKDKKSVTCVQIDGKNCFSLKEIPLVPVRDMYEIKGTYLELTAQSYYRNMDREGYFHVILTDEEDIMGAVDKLRTIYPNIMKLDYDNRRTSSIGMQGELSGFEKKSPAQLFDELYEKQNGTALSDEKREYINKLIVSISEEGM